MINQVLDIISVLTYAIHNCLFGTLQNIFVWNQYTSLIKLKDDKKDDPSNNKKKVRSS